VQARQLHTRLPAQRRIDDAAAMLKIAPYLDRKPRDLSGGQRQRVAMARAVVRRPRAFLFDEPLSNLDAKLRMEVRAEIAALRRRFNTTTVYVTHDQVEAMTLADRVVVLSDGVVQQIGSPLEVYRQPANRFVATFLGTPTMIVVAKAAIAAPAPADASEVGVRPHDVEARGVVEGAVAVMTVEHIERLGQESFVFGSLAADPGGARFGALVKEEDGGVEIGKQLGLFVRPDRLCFFDDKGMRIAA
jgi:ABC-type sugar transport system ATPase subunit